MTVYLVIMLVVNKIFVRFMMMKLMYFLKTLHDKYSLLEYMYDVCIHKMCNMPL